MSKVTVALVAIIVLMSAFMVGAFGASPDAPCVGVTAAPWMSTVNGVTYVCTTTGPVAL